MSDKPAVISADYFNFEYKKGLKVCRLTFEVPYEHAKLVRDVLGDPPLPGEQVRVAIARLATPTAEPLVVEGAQAPPEGPAQPRTRKRSEIAKFKCGDPAFQEWMDGQQHSQERRLFLDDEDYTRAILLEALGITSRSELDTLPHKAQAWDRMLATFDNRAHIR